MFFIVFVVSRTERPLISTLTIMERKLSKQNFLLAITLLFISCTDFQRDNPEDERSLNYIAPSSSSRVSSSSIYVFSSSSVSSFTDTRDDKIYNLVKIGTQTWMAENLEYKTSSNSKCYNNSGANCEKYGRLYNWETAKVACPVGWHLPTKDEWNELIAGNEELAGKYLKAQYWGGTDVYGFAALPGGFGNSDDDFGLEGKQGVYWTASQYSNINAYSVYMYSEGDEVSLYPDNKSDFYSVRCVQGY